MSAKRSVVLAVVGIGTLVGAARSDVLRVDDDAAPGGDGSSWSRAYDSLTDALGAASSGDQLWVAKGVYVPTTPAGRDATFTIPDGVGVYGGFAGGESSLAQRGDPLDPGATLSGNGVSYHVVTILNAGPSTVLDGFFIIRGLADAGGGFRDRGAGVFADDSAPTLRNLVITDCHANIRGGAIALEGTSANFATISDCQIIENTTNSSGGGVSTEVPSTINRCDFVSNASGAGGALRLAGVGVHSVFDCEFRSNTASVGVGGAVSVLMTAPGAISVFDGCDFRSNSGPQAGAIGYLFDGDHTVRESRFIGNESTSVGANALRFDTGENSQLTIENSLFSGNDGDGNGAINNDSDGVLRLINSTVVNNHSTTVGGGVFCPDGDTRIDNSILWGNDGASSGGQDDNLWTNLVGTVALNRSIVQSLGLGDPAPAGVGNLSADPVFVDADGPDNNPGTADDNVRLMPGSPAIDRGNNLLLSPFASDDYYAGSRFVDDTGTPDNGVGDGANPIVDLGCAEFQGMTPLDPCNVADLAEPFGVLDFADVLAFLSAFGAMTPAADLASPFGTYDFADVLAFLSAFGAGCP